MGQHKWTKNREYINQKTRQIKHSSRQVSYSYIFRHRSVNHRDSSRTKEYMSIKDTSETKEYKSIKDTSETKEYNPTRQL
jgi:hypothetical protein